MLGYVEYSYDAQGNLSSALQGGPGVGTVLTSLSHDLRGRKTSMTGPDHGTWSYVHNAFGELVRQTDAKQQVTTATFDRAGRLIRRDEYGAGENPASVQPLDRAEWIWIQGKVALEDTHRRVTTSQMEPLPRLSRNFVYDLLGRVEEVHTTIQGTSYEERTTYDQFGRVFQTFDASGLDRGAEHLYNAQGYLSQVIEARFSATTTEVHYQVLGMNARGQVTSHRKGGT
ncbi:MAG: RHS repeat protein, partial [Gammaproteobacteria bacterium]|nr:RHS repeat protein [Gammaproteobacteria bacterium]